jgi:truncated hemoglobin YjbI
MTPTETQSGPSDFDRLGGQEPIAGIISKFIDRVVSDMMIGYLFRHVAIDELKARETTFAAKHLGGAAPYTGRPLEVAHKPHRILSAQFDRRLVILRDTLEELEVPSDIRYRWLDHNRSLHSSIVRNESDSCSV